MNGRPHLSRHQSPPAIFTLVLPSQKQELPMLVSVGGGIRTQDILFTRDERYLQTTYLLNLVAN